MLIEVTVKPDHPPVETSIGNEKYVFLPDAKGRRVAEVWIVKHIECFLERTDMYREVLPLPEHTPFPEAAPVMLADKDTGEKHSAPESLTIPTTGTTTPRLGREPVPPAPRKRRT